MAAITNGSLQALLRALGFEAGTVAEKNCRIWRHPGSGCTLTLPANKIDERPRPADLIGIPSQLELQGHLSAEDFEHFLAEGRLPSAARAAD